MWSAIILLLTLCEWLAFSFERHVKIWDRGLDFEEPNGASVDYGKWLLENPTLEAAWALALWKLNISYGDVCFFNEFCRHEQDPKFCNPAFIEFYAIFTYCTGPGWMQPGNLPQAYYRSCGNYVLQYSAYLQFGICSFSQHAYSSWLRYECNLFSLFYEYRRPPEIQDKFGMLPARAIIFVLTPLLIFIVALGVLNLIVMRHVKNGADGTGEGSVFYHLLQIGSDVTVAVLEISPDFFVLSRFANDAYHVFTGSCLSVTAQYYWNNVHWSLRAGINDFGLIALALLANDRYKSIKDPVEYFKENVSRRRRVLLAAIIALLTNGLDVVAQCNFIKSNKYVYATFPIPQSIRTAYLFVCFYTVLRSMIGMKLKIRDLMRQKTKRFGNQQQQGDFLRRSASLALQICFLNGLSLLICTMAALFLALQRTFQVANLESAHAFVEHIYSVYLELPQHLVVVLSSNIGFFVHCYYSKLYRRAVLEVFGPMLKLLRKCCFCCPRLFKTSIQPVVTEIENTNTRAMNSKMSLKPTEEIDMTSRSTSERKSLKY